MIDSNDPKSLNNWVQQLNLICKPFYYHGAIGSVYFAGWALFATVIPVRANRKGRKNVITWTFLFTTIAMALTLIN